MQSIIYGEMKVFGGRAHPALLQEICAYLGTESGKVVTYNFSDGETFCQIDDNVRGNPLVAPAPGGRGATAGGVAPSADPGPVVESLDGGNLGPERRLYLREMVARFGYVLALNWNLGEENTQTPALSSYFELMDRLLPTFLNAMSAQKIRGTRVLLK